MLGQKIPETSLPTLAGAFAISVIHHLQQLGRRGRKLGEKERVARNHSVAVVVWQLHSIYWFSEGDRGN
jgi:hypothetical protein